MPKLSVVIPTLNEEEYLPGLLQDLASQSWREFEVIVSDAGSEDATVKIAQTFGAKVVVGPRLGPGYGRNLGAKNAQGKLILFLDADVRLPHPDFLAEAVQEFEKKSLAAAGFYGRSWDGNLAQRLVFRVGNLVFRLTRAFDPHVPGWAILVQREIHEKVGGFEEKPIFREDHVYVSRVRRYGKIGFLKAGPIWVSSRRFKEYGTLRTLALYMFTELARPFGHIAYERFGYVLGGKKKKAA